MATPLTGVQHLEGVAVLPNRVSKVESSKSASNGGAFNGSSSSSQLESPILIFSFFHKAIRNELDALHRSAMAFATGDRDRSDIRPLSERYHFIRSMYRHHANAEDEVRHFLIFF